MDPAVQFAGTLVPVSLSLLQLFSSPLILPYLPLASIFFSVVASFILRAEINFSALRAYTLLLRVGTCNSILYPGAGEEGFHKFYQWWSPAQEFFRDFEFSLRWISPWSLKGRVQQKEYLWNGLEVSMRAKPPTLALGSEDLTWLQKSWWLVSVILWGSQVHEGFRQKDLQDVLSALTGCHLMITPTYLSLAYGLTLAKVRGWQRDEDAVRVYRSRVFSSPLQMYSILYLSPRKSFEGGDEHHCRYLSPAPIPMFLVVLKEDI